MAFSCSETNSPNEFFWGKMTYYDDFCGKKHKAEVMEKTLDFEFNEDAMTLLGNNIIELELIKKDENGNYVKADNIHVYVDGEKCEDNIIKITPQTKSIRLGLQFADPKNAKEGNHSYNLKVKNHGGLTRIDNVDLSVAHNVILAHEWVVKKENIYNPLAVICFWALAVLAGSLFIWFMLIKPARYKHFKITRIRVSYGDKTREIMLSKRYKAICNNKKEGSVSNIFKGKVQYHKNEFWKDDLIIKRKNKTEIEIVQNRAYSFNPATRILALGKSMEITRRDSNEKVTFKI
jgi:hypothetical protein